MYFIKLILAAVWRKGMGRIRDKKVTEKIDVQTRDVKGYTVLMKEERKG